ncbi:PGAP1-like alpha/beta domain-containing protein [Nocardioides zeicaulis]|uniref:GPI inositol-deacylase PGAP1-like alpha/beta domain-containing protein n=1 Tax=Nocardioides zeicaulis TaxID=1776857 RepID=A0ABV6E411_9ACTN
MSTGQLPPIESVSGGSHGVEAGYEQMLALAERYESQAADFVEMAGLGAKVMANGDLLESAILSPGSFADAEVQVLDATTGTDGLTVRAIGIEADALGVRAVVAAFKASDALSKHATEMIDNALGRMLLPAALASLPALLLAGGAGYAYYSTLSPAEQQALEKQLADDLGQLLHDHPELAQHLINGGGGLIQTLLPGIGLLDPADGPIDQATTNDAARLLSLLLGNSTDYQVNPLSDLPPGVGAESEVPGDLRTLIQQLDRTNQIDARDPNAQGAIQIQQVGDKYIVYIPGTDDMSPIPQDGEHARDMETNYQLIGGLDSAYGNGIKQAMLDAGLEGKDVMLVGHSQGGMVSTSLAADPSFTQHFNVEHVVTAGSPTAQVPHLPDGTHAIHFENRGDAVPLLDGEDNPDDPNRTTIKFDEGSSDIGGNHGLDHYANGAAAADASSNGSIQDEIDRMRDDGYLGSGASGPVVSYQVTR